MLHTKADVSSMNPSSELKSLLYFKINEKTLSTFFLYTHILIIPIKATHFIVVIIREQNEV